MLLAGSLSLLGLLVFSLPGAHAEVTVYGLQPHGISATGSAGSMPTKAAYDKTVLIPPPPPQPPSTAFSLQLQPQSSSVPGLSIYQSGLFFGFSIEMSVVNQVLGRNSSFIQVPFLNLMGNIQHRAGGVYIRCGGNTQEFATFVETPLPKDAAIAKERANLQNPTQTPAVLYTLDLFNIFANISALVNVKWFLGIPFNDTTNWRLQIAEHGQRILGDNLLGLQAGNEPDLYAPHHHRPPTYGPFDYFGEFGDLVRVIADNPNIPVKNKLIGPSIASDWLPEMVWDTGFIDAYKDSLSILTVERYPNNNCFAQFGGSGSPKTPQDEFIKYLNHTAGQELVRPYLNSTNIAQQHGKPFMMFETNTASCGGFPGISNTFGAALWALDYGYQMAHSNFSGALLHVGGQNVYYNPFTAPPTNESAFHHWTIGAVFYSVMIMAESFGKSNQSQILDLNANNGNIHTPAYVIYDGGRLSKVALFNYVDDKSGASNYTATISVGGGETGSPNSTPAQVRVKYLSSDSVATKDTIRWANQTFGLEYEVDGHLKGDLHIETITCDQQANTCQVPVPAPGFALVFFGDPHDSANDITFETTTYSKLMNTATVDQVVLQTSNGMSGKERGKLGSTSFGSVEGNGNGAPRLSGAISATMVAAAALFGTLVLWT